MCDMSFAYSAVSFECHREEVRCMRADVRGLCLIDLLAVYDGSNDVCLSHLLDVVVQVIKGRFFDLFLSIFLALKNLSYFKYG
jgi:hypothetical protein